MPDPSPWWSPHVHADRRPFLLARGRIAAALRAWFGARDFVEVETAALQVSPGNEAHLHAFATRLLSPDGTEQGLYLRTSPEFACKKLLTAGERRIFDFARVFRNRERSALHHPEFTMLEWYRAGEPYTAVMQDCVEIVAEGASAVGAKRLTFRGADINPAGPPERLTVAEAFMRHAGIDLLDLLDLLDSLTGGIPDRDRLAAAAKAIGIRVAEDDLWGDIFSRILVERVEPHLGRERLTLLYEYPAVQSALARPSALDPRVAERFELYACGVELANGFGELTDAVEQRRRLEAEMDVKARVYGERYPIDEDFIAAVAQMPQASGVALGFDRLVMLATGATRIDQVLWSPVPEPP
ncbi:MAG: EF-P lysine aminoacylase GenX [Rhizobiales bacterium]|nr:EF-P lysine aminoacylase GenX [Hyphomicrobiales bacterium]